MGGAYSANVSMAPLGGILALLLTGTHFSVSSGVGFLALFGVSVQVGVIMIEYINHCGPQDYSIEDAAVEGAILRLTANYDDNAGGNSRLVARGAFSEHWLGLAATVCHRDCRRIACALLLSIYLLPTMYVWVAATRTTCPLRCEWEDAT